MCGCFWRSDGGIFDVSPGISASVSSGFLVRLWSCGRPSPFGSDPTPPVSVPGDPTPSSGALLSDGVDGFPRSVSSSPASCCRSTPLRREEEEEEDEAARRGYSTNI